MDDQTRKLKEGDWAAVLAGIAGARLASAPADNDPSCSGGSSESLRLYSGDNRKTYDQTLNHCGVASAGPLVGDFGAVKAVILNVSPPPTTK